jgi:hypothetical protein
LDFGWRCEGMMWEKGIESFWNDNCYSLCAFNDNQIDLWKGCGDWCAYKKMKLYYGERKLWGGKEYWCKNLSDSCKKNC